MLNQANAIPTPHRRLPWNKGKLTGAKPPLRPKHVWSIRTKLQIGEPDLCQDARRYVIFVPKNGLEGRSLVVERQSVARSLYACIKLSMGKL
jgi:hypothetical protein